MYVSCKSYLCAATGIDAGKVLAIVFEIHGSPKFKV